MVSGIKKQIHQGKMEHIFALGNKMSYYYIKRGNLSKQGLHYH